MTDSGDTSVSLAIVSTDVKHVLKELVELNKRVDRICDQGDRRGERIATLETGQRLTTQWQVEHGNRHTRETLVLKAWSVGTGTLAATIGSLVAWLKG